MKKISLILFLCISTVLFSQGPPAMSRPKDNQTKLIDELIKVSNYKQDLMKFGMSLVFNKAHKFQNGKNIELMSDQERFEIVNSIDFDKFKKRYIYNAFSLVSESDLQKLINLYKGANNLKGLFLNNYVIIKNYSSMINKKTDKLLKQKVSTGL